MSRVTPKKSGRLVWPESPIVRGARISASLALGRLRIEKALAEQVAAREALVADDLERFAEEDRTPEVEQALRELPPAGTLGGLPSRP